MTKKSFKLGERDAAIIFKDGGGTELIFPSQNDDDIAFPSAVELLKCVILYHQTGE